MPVSPLDFVLLQCGSPGYYQVFIGFLLCCLQLPIIFSSELFEHFIRQPPHRCQLTPQQIRRFESSLNGLNLHRNEWYPIVDKQRPEISLASPLIDELMSLRQNTTIQQFDQCNIFVDPLHHWRGTRPCQNGWEFWTPNNEVNLVTEFSLVCDRDVHLHSLKAGLAVSAVLGALLMGLLADRWGRTKTLHFSVYLFVASSLSTFFANDFVQFALFYNLQMFFVAAIEVCAFVLLLELVATPFQLRAALLWALFRSLTSLLVPVLVSVVHSWRFVQLSVAIPSLAFFTYIFVLPHSPLWLTVVKHNLADAVRVLERFGKFNGKRLSLNQLNQHIQNLYIASLSFPSTSFGASEPTLHSSHKSTLTIQNLSIYSRKSKKAKLSQPGPTLRWLMVNLFFLFFVTVTLQTELLGRHSLVLHQNASVNALYNTFLQIGLLVLVYQFTCWCGASRLVQSCLFTLQGGLIVGAVLLREQLKARAVKNDFNYDQRLLLLPPLMVVLARSLSVSSYALLWYFAVKTIPTRIRAAGIGFCYFWIKLAHLASPYLIEMADHFAYHQVLILFGGLALLGGVLTLLFPNFDRRPLPNTIEDLVPRSVNSLDNNTLFKRYPSYSDLKCGNGTKPKSRAEQQNVYSFPSLQESASLHETSVMKSIEQTEVKRPNSSTAARPESTSGRSSSRKSSTVVTVNDTEKSSLSSNEHLSSEGVSGSIVRMSPSTSFVHHQPVDAKPSISRILTRPSVVSCPDGIEQDNDVYTIELGNEPISLDTESAATRAMIQGFTYTPQKFESGPIFTSRH